MVFEDRADAGRQLAARLRQLQLDEPVVLALPRGGVPVAAEVARALKAPLDLLLVRKIGAPAQPELAVAAVADGGEPALEIDEETLALSGTPRDYVHHEVPRQLREIERRRRLYLGARVPLELQGRTAVLVDDGIATGTTVRAAITALRWRKPARIVLAVPVAPAEELPRLRGEVDELVCLSAPEFFGAVGSHYRDFAQTSDEEVMALMHEFSR
ncbi:MAG: phosphoribosyltransferase family protein [Pseudomonadota bacterium]